MPKSILMLILVLLIPVLSACDSSKQSGYHGYLYFANGPYLMLFSLADGSRSLVTSMGNKSIHDISDFGKGRLLVAESAMVNSKEVHSISWVDVKTGQTSALYSFLSPG